MPWFPHLWNGSGVLGDRLIHTNRACDGGSLLKCRKWGPGGAPWKLEDWRLPPGQCLSRGEDWPVPLYRQLTHEASADAQRGLYPAKVAQQRKVRSWSLTLFQLFGTVVYVVLLEGVLSRIGGSCWHHSTQ